MPCSVHLAWDDRLTTYDFGPGHPLAPVRVELTMELARDLDVLSGLSVQRPEPATDAELELVHDPRYLAAVRRSGASWCSCCRAARTCHVRRGACEVGCTARAGTGETSGTGVVR